MANDIKSRQAAMAAEAAEINAAAVGKLDSLITQLGETQLTMVAASPEQHRICELSRNLANNARHLFNNQIKPLIDPAD